MAGSISTWGINQAINGADLSNTQALQDSLVNFWKTGGTQINVTRPDQNTPPTPNPVNTFLIIGLVITALVILYLLIKK